MDRRSFIKNAGVIAGGAVGTAIAAPAIAEAAPELKWRLTPEVPMTAMPHSAACLLWLMMLGLAAAVPSAGAQTADSAPPSAEP